MREAISSVRKWMGPQSPRKLSPCASLGLGFVWAPRILYKYSKIVLLYQNGSVSHLSDFIAKVVFKMSWEIHTHLYASQRVGDKEIYVFHKFWKLTGFFSSYASLSTGLSFLGETVNNFQPLQKAKVSWHEMRMFLLWFPFAHKVSIGWNNSYSAGHSLMTASRLELRPYKSRYRLCVEISAMRYFMADISHS